MAKLQNESEQDQDRFAVVSFCAGAELRKIVTADSQAHPVGYSIEAYGGYAKRDTNSGIQ